MLLLLACTAKPEPTPQDSQPVVVESPPPESEAPDDSPVESPPDSPIDTGEPLEWPEDGVVLDQVKVVDAAGARADRALVLVSDSIWAELDAGLDWPEQLEVRDLQGKTVIPGLIDSHVHLAYGGAPWWVGDTVEDNLSATLAWGVVAVVDLGGPTWTWSLRDRIAAGELSGPRMLASGPFLTAEGSHPCELSNDRALCHFVGEDPVSDADALVDGGADLVKLALTETGIGVSWPRMDPSDLGLVAAEHPTMVHVSSAQDWVDAIDAGATDLAHVPFDDGLGAEVAATIDSVSSTRGATDGLPRTLAADLGSSDYAQLPASVRSAWQAVQADPSLVSPGWAEADEVWTEQAASNLAALVAVDAPVLAGSDAGYYFVPHGVALHWELEALVEAGKSPIEALAAATSEPAARWGWSDLGWIGAGYRADLIVLDADPSEDITNTRAIHAVVLAGEWREQPGATWVSAGGDFCLDDRDCAGSELCDLVDHVCADSCTPYASTGCPEETWCNTQDGLSSTSVGVCHPGDDCSWSEQDCAPDLYGENCVPADKDTNSCLASGPRTALQTCNYSDPALMCSQGHYCSTITWRCYELCEPGPDAECGVGTCHQEYASDGSAWFGLCY